MTSSFTLHASGAADPAVVWERYLYPRHWPEWSPHITGVEGPDEIATGVTGRVRGPLGVSVPFTVTDVDPLARRWHWRVQAGPVVVTLLHWVTAGPDGGTTTGLRLRGPLPVLAGYTPLAQIALQRLVRP